MNKRILLCLCFILMTVPALADSPKYDLSAFGQFVVISVNKSFSPQRNFGILKTSILAVKRSDKLIRITTSVIIPEYDAENENYIDTYQTYDLKFSDEDEAEKLFFRLMEQISN